MAEIISPSEASNALEGSFEGWTEGRSKSGALFYYRVKDDAGNTKKPDGDNAHQVDASGPSFSGVQCNWTSGTSGNTDSSFANKTGISWYKLTNTVGWTYQLTINATDTYDFTFHTQNDSYTLSVWTTKWTHEVTYTTTTPTVTSVDGD